ncbi:MAG: sulfite exporter TauE/SafE family protein [Kordiimonadaceae bacterium]|nr:sulfite exporter TauE/SafE family protein [Kordiimonadaceae bacterium]
MPELFMGLSDHLVPLLLAGALAGFMAGLLGIGGGVVTIPALFTVFGDLGIEHEWRMHAAIGTSLAIIIATNSSSVYAHHKKGGVDWGIVKDWWYLIALGALAGAFFAKSLKTTELIYFFSALIALLAIKMLLPLDKFKFGETLPGGVPRFTNPLIIGFFSSVMGIGGGSFSVPYLTLYSVPIHRAVGTAALAGLVISISGGFGYLAGGWNVAGLPAGMAGFIHVPSMVIVAVAAVVLAPLGVKAAHALPKKALSIIFGVFLIAAAARMLSAV